MNTGEIYNLRGELRKGLTCTPGPTAMTMSYHLWVSAGESMGGVQTQEMPQVQAQQQ